MSIEVQGVSKRFGDFLAVDDVSFAVSRGELVALFGASGSGKTTLLRIVAGLDAVDSGRVLFDGEDATRRDVRQRRVGFVFQHFALFDHMTVFENVAFGLRVRPRALRPSRAEIGDRVAGLLARVQLAPLAGHHPAQLSGGQRQRVALARALAIEPRVLLLDEPFGSLDSQVRGELRQFLRRLHDQSGIASVLVTHDPAEALEIADRMVLISRGQVARTGTPREVLSEPAAPPDSSPFGSAI